MDINDIRISPLLSVADSPDLVVYLLSRGAHIKIRNNLGETLLHLAVQARNSELVNFYLEYGLSANDKTLRGDTPLTYAVQSGFVEIMDLLLEYGADYKTTNPFNKNLVHLALAKNQREACRRLVTLDINLNQLDRNGISPLHSAAGRNYCDIIKILIENNANIDIRKNATPLHMAADREECGDAVAVLLEQGAAVDVVTYNGDLPLHKAAASGNKQAVKLLHRKDFQIRKNRCGPTPLMMAEAFAKTINGVLN
ncbi:putative ankyrin repeat protein RF_0381 isoform X1 [Dendroctonus ponderosae]|uniref:putative ankyrin repeat protein RF_0381 isoform X1 n=1 Tax=Dendroctonus ponderosae TaxID=77166 RepID=UPI002034DFB8|nr:putative ankyrin repeat protein RF_0381 isoform X1 [Dendroctonus ponderosae]